MEIRFATIKDLERITALEKECFPVSEAASRSAFEKRLALFANHFWLLEEGGSLISAINGMTTNIPTLQDEMYENACLHNEAGDWQMIFGVETHPAHQGKGYGAKLMNKVIEDCKNAGRKGIVLTCKDVLVPFYERFGFVNEGKSLSEHGGAVWYELRLTF